MSRKSRSPLSRPASREPVAGAIAQPLEIFEEALTLLGRFERPTQGAGGMPAPALPSLLARCEAVVEREGAAGPCLLICVDGLDPLSPDWWAQHAGGLGVQVIPRAEDVAALDAQLAVFERSERRQGRAALTLAGLDVPPALLRAFGAVRLLTWHPWSSFMAAPRGVTLDAHCQALGRALDRFEGVAILPVEAGGPSARSQAAAIAAAFGWSLPSRPEASVRGPARMQPPDNIEGGAVYRQLCERLGYAPDSVALPPRAEPGPDGSGAGRGKRTLEALERRYAQAEVEPVDPPVQVSWFLPRLAALGLPAPITDDDGLKTLVAELDKALAGEDAEGALAELTLRLPAEKAALSRILAAAHFCRSRMHPQALATLGQALGAPQGNAPWLRAAVAVLLCEMGHAGEALLANTAPLLNPGVLGAEAGQALAVALEAAGRPALPPAIAAPGLAERLRAAVAPEGLEPPAVAFDPEALPGRKIIVACHHKSGTNFLRRCFESIAADAGLRIWFKFYDTDPGPDQWDICFHQHSRIAEELFSVPDFRGIHCVRHPMSLIYSAALYHEKCSEPWVDVPLQAFTPNTFRALSDRETYNEIKNPDTPLQRRAELMQVDPDAARRDAGQGADVAFAGRTYREILRSFSRIEDKLRFEMSCFSKGVVMDMVRFPKDLRFFQLTLEGISHDPDMKDLAAAFRHLGFEGEGLRGCLQRAAPHCLWNKTEIPAHGTSGVSDSWRRYFRGDLLADYRALFGQPEVALGFGELPHDAL